ncbi:MAG: hypothetical protein IIC67_02125 [Thaumarchaeota archaeon]|nr:hypothetical protein [Nitrososphaerota archaeon]
MVYKVVSTKLTEEEHSKLLDECNRQGCTPSHLIKNAILNQLDEKHSDISFTIPTSEKQQQKSIQNMSIEELERQLKEITRE